MGKRGALRPLRWALRPDCRCQIPSRNKGYYEYLLVVC